LRESRGTWTRGRHCQPAEAEHRDRYIRDRDTFALQGNDGAVSAEESAAREQPHEDVTPERVRDYLSNLWDLWMDTEPEGRRALAEAAFDRIDALGLSLSVYPSAEAEKYGRAAAFRRGVLEVSLASSIGRYGRGERSQNIDFVLMA
jgi:hypothetical protein